MVFKKIRGVGSFFAEYLKVVAKLLVSRHNGSVVIAIRNQLFHYCI